MIHHVVLIRLKPEVDGPRTRAFLDEARSLLSPIPGVKNFRSGIHIKSDSPFPCALVMDFSTTGDLQAYQVHPEHQSFVKEVLGPIVEEKQVYDYDC